MIGMDSSAIIDLFKENENLKKVLAGLGDKIALNQISYLELMFGIDEKNQKNKIEEEFYDSLFNSFLNLKLSNVSCKKASKIMRELSDKGEIIEAFDCVIAGIYLTNGVKRIITRNVKHFSRIKDFEVISY